MKNILKVTFTVILTLALFSCSEEQGIPKINSIKTEGIVNFDLSSKRAIKVMNFESKSTTNENQHSISHVFTGNSKMKSFDNEDELKKYLKESPDKTYGKYEIFIDNEIAYSVEIVKGEKFNEEIFESSSSNKTASSSCTFAEVKACAIKRIHDKNWFDMALCIFVLNNKLFYEKLFFSI